MTDRSPSTCGHAEELGIDLKRDAVHVDRRLARGARAGSAKLTDEQYAEILFRFDRGETARSIARGLPVTYNAVTGYIRRWRPKIAA